MPWLFSYGSNNPDQLAHRLGHTGFEVTAAVLPGYERVFRGFSRRWSGGTASLRKKRGANTYGFLAKVSSSDLATLDRFEGVPMGVYERAKVDVEAEGGIITAYAYIHTSTEFNAPSRAYLEAVAKTISGFWSGSSGRVTADQIPIR